MLNIIMGDLVPIFAVMVLGFFAGKYNAFSYANARSFNKLVLNFALPAALFVSIVKADRAMLFSDIRLSAVSFGVIVACYFVSFFCCMKIFKHTKSEAAIAGLIGGSPTIGYLGFAVLEPIYGATATTGLVVAVVAIVVNAITIPLCLFLMNPSTDDSQSSPSKGKSGASSVNAKAKSKSGGGALEALLNAIKQPVAWSPILAVIIVLLGIDFPSMLDPSFELLGKANASVAVFAAGLTLAGEKFEFDKEVLFNSFLKLLFMPAAMLGIGLLVGMSGEKLQMLVLCGALPPVFSGMIISSRFQIYVRTSTSSVAVSTFLFMFTAPFWVYISRLIAG